MLVRTATFFCVPQYVFILFLPSEASEFIPLILLAYFCLVTFPLGMQNTNIDGIMLIYLWQHCCHI